MMEEIFIQNWQLGEENDGFPVLIVKDLKSNKQIKMTFPNYKFFGKMGEAITKFAKNEGKGSIIGIIKKGDPISIKRKRKIENCYDCKYYGSLGKSFYLCWKEGKCYPKAPGFMAICNNDYYQEGKQIDLMCLITFGIIAYRKNKGVTMK